MYWQLINYFNRVRLPAFLAGLLLFLIGYPYLHQAFSQHIALVEASFAIIMILGVSLFHRKKQTFLIMTLLAGLILIGILVSSYLNNSSIIISTLLVEFIFFLIVFIHLLHYIYSQEKITLNKLYAAIISYLVLGILFALLYTIASILIPNAFEYTAKIAPASSSLSPHPGFFSEALYFSFVTLGTLGYGDWIPVIGSIKMIASLEAIIGQLYIAMLIARLVGIQISQQLLKKGH